MYLLNVISIVHSVGVDGFIQFSLITRVFGFGEKWKYWRILFIAMAFKLNIINWNFEKKYVPLI